MGCCFSHSFLEARTILGRNTGSSYEVVDDRGHSSNPPIITTSQINNTDSNSYQPPKRPKLVHSTSLRKISHAVPVPVALPNTARVTRSESVPAFLTNLNKENQIPLLQQVQAKYSIANPLESLPIAIDVPRLINNTEVKDEHGVLFKRPSSDASNSHGREMLIKSFLEVLITKLRISDAESILSRYDAIVLQRMESDLPPRLKEFLITLGDDSPVIKLLKVVNQALIATAVTKIKVYFMGHFVLKDVRNGWDVVVSFGDAHAVVSHIKWEETLPAAFKLCWQLDYIFDKHTWDLKDATLRIVKLEFTALMDAEEQEGVQELVDGFSA